MSKIYLDPKRRVPLPLILDEIAEKGKKLVWSVLDLYVLGDFEPGDYFDRIIKHFLNRVDASVFLTWDKLYEMAKKITVTIDLKLIGCQDEKIVWKIAKSFKELDTYPRAEKILPLYEILIFIDDGILRDILAKDQAIVKRCIEKFGPYPVTID